MKKTLSILNLVSVILVVSINYLSQAFRINNTTIGEMSSQYDNLFTPASYAFSIWGFIFLSLFAYAIYQIKCAFDNTKSDDFITQTNYWFIVANVFNSLWVFAFVYDFIWISVLLMLGILYALIQIIIKTFMEIWDAPLPIIAFVWWPICLYSGWISVATIANISTFLVKTDWQGGFMSAEHWTIFMILVAALLNIFMVFARNMREFALVGVWALAAIFIRHQDSNNILAYTALIASISVFAVIAWHGYKNRHTNPIHKKLND